MVQSGPQNRHALVLLGRLGPHHGAKQLRPARGYNKLVRAGVRGDAPDLVESVRLLPQGLSGYGEDVLLNVSVGAISLEEDDRTVAVGEGHASAERAHGSDFGLVVAVVLRAKEYEVHLELEVHLLGLRYFEDLLQVAVLQNQDSAVTGARQEPVAVHPSHRRDDQILGFGKTVRTPKRLGEGEELEGVCASQGQYPDLARVAAYQVYLGVWQLAALELQARLDFSFFPAVKKHRLLLIRDDCQKFIVKGETDAVERRNSR